MSEGRPGAAELREVAGRLFSGLALSYDRVLDWATLYQDRYWKKWALERSSPSRGEVLLDLGCGTCVAERRIEGTGCSTVGLDVTEEMLRLGMRKRPSVIGLLNGDAEALPFAPGSFDVVVSFYAVKYCRIEPFVSEASRVLRPGGRLVVYDFVRPRGKMAPILGFYIYGLLRVLGRLLRRVDRGIAYTFEELPGIVRRTTWNDELPAALRRRGLVVVSGGRLSGGTVQAFCARKEPASVRDGAPREWQCLDGLPTRCGTPQGSPCQAAF